MPGHTAKVRTTVVSGVAAALAIVLGATFWPASGHDVDASTADRHAVDSVDAAEFDGWLYANPETGCVEPPPRDLDLPDVVPVEPGPAPGLEDELGERTHEREEDERLPRDRPGPDVHVEPWPACDDSRSATTVGQGSQDADG